MLGNSPQERHRMEKLTAYRLLILQLLLLSPLLQLPKMVLMLAYAASALLQQTPRH